MTQETQQTGPLSHKHVGKYTISELLARGGMGDIYRAVDNIDREVAFKVLHSGFGSDAIRRFQTEAKTLAKYFSHPNILKLYEFFEFNLPGKPVSLHAIVTEYIRGKTMGELLALKSYGIPDEFYLLIIREICSALETPHHDQVIHRDIKPDNIMVGQDGKVVLMDFGIVKNLEDSVNMTMSGVMTGTPQYSSPEQLLKYDDSEKDYELQPATDLFPLGIILYEVATGVHPFAKDSKEAVDAPFAVLSRIMKMEFAPPEKVNPAIPPDLEKIIKRCLKKKPKQRYLNATELRQEIDQFLEKKKFRYDSVSIASYLSHWMKQIMAPNFPDNLPRVSQRLTPLPATTRAAGWKRSLMIGVTTFFLLVGVGYLWLAGNCKHEEMPVQETLRPAVGTSIVPPVVSEKVGNPPEAALPPAKNLVAIAGGIFLMGSEEGTQDEKPVHKVRIQDFYLMRHEVTVAEYQECISAGACKDLESRWKKRCHLGQPGLENRPVNCVSWLDTITYANYRSKEEKLDQCYQFDFHQAESLTDDNPAKRKSQDWLDVKTVSPCNGYRLPTEAEWEYAARVGSHKAFPFSNELETLKEYGWIFENSGGNSHPVEQKKPSEWGLYDMHGNVWEWVGDWYGPYSEAEADNPSGPASGIAKVNRGGSWDVGPEFCTVSVRNRFRPSGRSPDLGFRLARGK
jgi:formylglycine-generating enzyme required for sulfatase activity/serine/threonine protein kinase